MQLSIPELKADPRYAGLIAQARQEMEATRASNAAFWGLSPQGLTAEDVERGAVQRLLSIKIQECGQYLDNLCQLRDALDEVGH